MGAERGKVGVSLQDSGLSSGSGVGQATQSNCSSTAAQVWDRDWEGGCSRMGLSTGARLGSPEVEGNSSALPL